ncbi:MAG: Lrp/AsnC ligand binding domain-containing protein [Vicinamibacteria bacterium]
MKAYVLINVRAGKAREVVREIRPIEGVRSANACWGRPDTFTLVEVANEKALADTVLAKIQAIDGVESTDTHIVIE